jgi:hypothetical protein
VQLKESCRGQIVPPAMVGHFRQQRGWIAYCLIELIAEASRAPSGAHEQCCCLAAYVYHQMHFKPYTFLTGVQSLSLGKLKQSLRTTDLGTCWGDDIELLLWVLVTAAAVEDGARVWFVDLFKRVRKTFIPKPGLNRMKHILRRFLWNERTSGRDCDKIYKEIVSSAFQGEAYEMKIELGIDHEVAVR